jgi:hypothetical protein
MVATTTMKPSQSSGNFSSGGSGKFKPLRGRGKKTPEYNPFNPPKYDRMSFKNSRDPVYIAFDHIDKQPLSKVASDFFKENISMPVSKLFTELIA